MSQVRPKGKIYKRISGLFATGAAPGVIVGVIGDIFTPRNGWLAVAIIGLLAAIVAVYLLFSLWSANGGVSRPWWRRLLENDEDINWVWDAKTPFLSHGVHVVIVFAISCLIFSSSSFAALKSGGVLAKEIPMVSVAQKHLGIAREMLKQQELAVGHLSSLDSQAGNFKKELSEDPRKELANTGVAWATVNFENAVRAGDKRTVRLFLEGDMPISNRLVLIAWDRSNDSIRLLLSEHPHLYDSKNCAGMINVSSESLDSLEKTSVEKKGLVKAFCKSPEGQSLLLQQLEAAKKSLSDEYARVAAEKEKRQDVKGCVEELQKSKNFHIRNAADDNSSYSKQENRQKMYYEIREVFYFKDSQREINDIFMDYCVAESHIEPNPPSQYNIDNVKKWEILISWLR